MLSAVGQLHGCNQAGPNKRQCKARTERRKWTELKCFSFWRTDQWANSNALQRAPSNAVGGLRHYAHARVSQWPMDSPCLSITVRQKAKPCQFSLVQLHRSVRALTARHRLRLTCSHLSHFTHGFMDTLSNNLIHLFHSRRRHSFDHALLHS